MIMPNDDWEKWSVFVLKELERLNDCYEESRKELTRIGNEITTLKTEMKIKGGIWGAIGAMVPICVGLLIYLARSV